MSFFKDIFGAGFGAMAANKNRRDAEKMRTQNLELIGQLDWEPEYASEYAPTYKKAQSPIAGSYIESMLLGNNPDSVRSSAPGAAVQKALLQQRQNSMFGTPEKRLERQRAVDRATPWEVKAPTRQVRTEQTEEAEYKAGNPATSWTSKGLRDALDELGVSKERYDSPITSENVALRELMYYTGGGKEKATDAAADAAAALLRQYGSIDKARKAAKAQYEASRGKG